MATTPALLTIEEYLNTSYRPDRDYVDGEIEERSEGERDHNRIQLLIGAWFLSHESAWQIEVIPEQRTRVSGSRVRIPDICLIRRGTPTEQVTVTPRSFASKSSNSLRCSRLSRHKFPCFASRFRT